MNPPLAAPMPLVPPRSSSSPGACGRRPQILLVDDDAIVIELLGRALSDLGQVRFATDGPQALQAVSAQVPDLLLLDVGLPRMSGFELLRQLREQTAFDEVPVIFLTSHDDPAEELLGLTLGAVDFIHKPPRIPLVQARVRTHLRLKVLTDTLRQKADTDGLTGIANRRHFDDTLAHEWMRAQRDGSELSLLLIDIDHFKSYNDQHGHPEGDRCLQQVAQTLQASLRRPADRVARYGGEEFVVLLPQTSPDGATEVAQKLLQAVDALQLPHHSPPGGGGPRQVTVSIGVAGGPVPVQGDPAERVRQADQALYQAKHLGRHQVVCQRGQTEGAG
jgi:diguanylate cyclase (GGDEF)-like protein